MVDANGIHALRTELVSIVDRLDTYTRERRDFNLQDADSFHRRLDQICRAVFQFTRVNVLEDDVHLSFVIESVVLLQQLEQLNDNMNEHSGFQAPLLQIGRAGRPRFNIARNQLEYLLQNGFTGPDVSQMLGVLLRTIRRRIQEYGIFHQTFRTIVSNDELDGIVREIASQFPRIGYRRLEGELRSRGTTITRARVRESLRRVDPIGVLQRCRGLCSRRQYSVYGPLALWHIDGHHKLIR